MKVIYDIEKAKLAYPTVVAIGVFDGVHNAHQHIIRAAVRSARNMQARSLVLTFWPHPHQKQSLYSLEHRLRILKELGVDICVVVNFNRRFAGITAEKFVARYLLKKLNCRRVFVGKNFRFGKNGAAGPDKLWELLKHSHCRVHISGLIKSGVSKVSSSTIRSLIAEGRLDQAHKLLGRRVSVFGKVVKGTGWGRKLGFPTANIKPDHEVIPPPGVYAVEVIIDKQRYHGLCNIGFRPTLMPADDPRLSIEVYILHFRHNIYGKKLEVQFIRKIRQEKKFPSPAALAQQIHRDIVIATNHYL